jgi:DNA-binding response OmpR family regulator
MQEINILWADDEIDLLKPHILFLQQKGYHVVPVSNGVDAVERSKQERFDLIFLDENMPGISGLEALTRIKAQNADVPVVMITKNEEEYLMNDAIGSRIADYLIKPVNPNQIWLSIKKLIDNKRLVTEKTTQNYQQDFRNIGYDGSGKAQLQRMVRAVPQAGVLGARAQPDLGQCDGRGIQHAEIGGES